MLQGMVMHYIQLTCGHCNYFLLQIFSGLSGLTLPSWEGFVRNRHLWHWQEVIISFCYGHFGMKSVPGPFIFFRLSLAFFFFECTVSCEQGMNANTRKNINVWMCLIVSLSATDKLWGRGREEPVRGNLGRLTWWTRAGSALPSLSVCLSEWEDTFVGTLSHQCRANLNPDLGAICLTFPLHLKAQQVLTKSTKTVECNQRGKQRHTYWRKNCLGRGRCTV